VPSYQNAINKVQGPYPNIFPNYNNNNIPSSTPNSSNTAPIGGLSSLASKFLRELPSSPMT